GCVIEESSTQIGLDNDEILFEIDYDVLANAKKLAQQNVSESAGEESSKENDEGCDEIITELKNNEALSPCVIIDTFEEEVKAKNFTIENLGVCYTHFLYDQNKLHSANLKQTKGYDQRQKECGALQAYHPLVIKTELSKNSRYICMSCYENKGEHVYQRVGRGVLLI
ncbi:hypothetical protein C1645_841446, partial [Glomus cerebriforme]